MNLFQLILKQMRQRSLSTALTCLSILLGMMLATSIKILEREGKNVFAQTDYGFDLLVGPKASPLQLVLNTIYHIDVSPGNIPYRMYQEMATGREPNGARSKYQGLVRWAVPYAVGDSYKGRRIVGTTPQLFGVDDEGKVLPVEKVPHFRGKENYTFAQGRAFAPNKFEAVIGSEVAADTGLKVGDTFHATHGFPGPNDIPDIHEEEWKVVGVLNETHTANDRVLFIPLLTFYAIFEHETGLEAIAAIQAAATTSTSKPAGSKPATAPETKVAATDQAEEKAYTLNEDGTINVKLPKEEWEVSAILVQANSTSTRLTLSFLLRNLPDAVGVNPADEMTKFFNMFMPKVSLLLQIIAVLVMAVAGVSILVSIYNSVAARNREIAIMRALGATRARILTAICLEAGFIGAAGGVLGLLAGHLLAAGGSLALQRIMGTGIAWWRFDVTELFYLPVVVVVSLIAGLVPALKAYSTPVAENLVA